MSNPNTPKPAGENSITAPVDVAAMRELTTLAWELSEEPEQLAKAYEHVGDLCDALVAERKRVGELETALNGTFADRSSAIKTDADAIAELRAEVAELQHKLAQERL